MKVVYGNVKAAFPLAVLVREGWLLLVLLGYLGMSRGNAQSYNMALTLSDGAQLTTLAFSGMGIMEGNLDSQSFFPPGKVADYFGFQYLRDNDLSNMGHDTDFLTRVANNVIYLLNTDQFNQLEALAVAQNDQINLYGYQRYPLMQAFRRLVDGDIPAGSPGLDPNAVKLASHNLYLLDGQLSFDRAVLYASIINSLDATQIAYLNTMKGEGFDSWPDITSDQINSKMQTLPQGTAVAVMGYAGDIFSWYVGSVTSDVYFCPERHGTYYGSFYLKDAPAVNVPGYNISESLTATAGCALSESAEGYVTPAQAALVDGLLDEQRNNLYAGATNIVSTRTQISTLLRSLLNSNTDANAVNTQVLELSGVYGDLDGEDNFNYATVFAQVYQSLTDTQKSQLQSLWDSVLTGTYADGTPFDFTLCTTPFLYSSPITDTSVLTPYIGNTDYLFISGGYEALLNVDLITNDPSPQQVHIPITLTALTTGGNTATMSYQFSVGDANGENWSNLGTAGSSPTCTWTPATAPTP